MASVTAYDKSMDLYAYLDGGGSDVAVVERMWHATFARALREMGFNRRATRLLWENLVCGNWKRLHLTQDERDGMTTGDWLDNLKGEVWYCSDRWSLDRVMRCHWLYRVATRGY